MASARPTSSRPQTPRAVAVPASQTRARTRKCTAGWRGAAPDGPPVPPDDLADFLEVSLMGARHDTWPLAARDSATSGVARVCFCAPGHAQSPCQARVWYATQRYLL